MRTRARIGLIALAGLATVGCVSPNSTTPRPTTSTTSTISDAAATRRAFLSLASNVFPGESDAELIELGEMVCSTIDEIGLDAIMEEFAGDMTISDAQLKDYGYFTGLAISAFCPWHSNGLT